MCSLRSVSLYEWEESKTLQYIHRHTSEEVETFKAVDGFCQIPHAKQVSSVLIYNILWHIL